MASTPVILVGALFSILHASTSTSLTRSHLERVSPELDFLYTGNVSSYFIGKTPTDARTARQVCQELTSLTGSKFNLLVLENDAEFKELKPSLQKLNVTGVWMSAEKGFDEHGDISEFWILDKGHRETMQYKNFRTGLSGRVFQHFADEFEQVSPNFFTQVHYPWLLRNSPEGGRCKNARFRPPGCEPVKCNVTIPDCTTETIPCQVEHQNPCSVERPGHCTAKCENCTVVGPICYASPKPCLVEEPEDCQAIQFPCTVETPPCTTKKPNCTTYQPPCDIEPPPECTTKKPCASEDCTPEVCHNPPIICQPPVTYCPPPQTVCPDPIITCKPPTLLCPPPKVTCPDPDVVCTKPQIICSSPVVNCPEYVSQCPPPTLNCPPPMVTCPPPIVECNNPEPCIPEPNLPEPCDPEPTTTTPKPCEGCGCIFMNKEHSFQWDVDTCRDEYHFICEG